VKKITRRHFIKTGVGTSLVLGAPWSCARHQPEPPAPKPKKKIKRPSATETNAQVAAIRGQNLDAMTRDAIDAIGGINTIVDQGETVFIKPNFVSFPWARINDCFHKGECTKPEIIIAVTEECLKAGAKEVVIGDGSHKKKFDWRPAVTLDGSTNLVREAERLTSKYQGKVSLVCLEVDSPSWVEVPSETYLGQIAVSGLVANADKVISIPVAKTHSWAQVTLAAKNFIGIASMARYAKLINNTYWDRRAFDHSSPRAIGQIYLDIVKGIQPDLSIIDFSIGIEGDGPTTGHGGQTVNMKEELGSWAIIASTDIMAADATAVRMMSFETDEIAHLSQGFKMGLGEIREEAIEIVGEHLDNMQMIWEPADLKS